MRMLRLLPTDPPGDRTGDPHQTRRYSHGCEEEDCQEGREEDGEEGRQEDQEALVLRGPETTRKPARSIAPAFLLLRWSRDAVTRPSPTSRPGCGSSAGYRRRGPVPTRRPTPVAVVRPGFRARSRFPPAPRPGRPDVALPCVALLHIVGASPGHAAPAIRRVVRRIIGGSPPGHCGSGRSRRERFAECGRSRGAAVDPLARTYYGSSRAIGCCHAKPLAVGDLQCNSHWGARCCVAK